MPRQSLHTLIWSQTHQHYELQTQRQPTQHLNSEEDPTFTRFLQAHSSFAFVGQAGRLSVRKEARSARSNYWYAYRKQAGHTSKQYLGATPQLTFTRLEQVARELNGSPPTWGDQKADPGRLLLNSRCMPPRLPSSLVKRVRLLNDLEAVINHPLTLLSAPAGSGKTTLLSDWIATLTQPQERDYRLKGADVTIAWLSLEELDNDPVRFANSYIAALQAGCALSKDQPMPGDKTLAMLRTQEMLPLSSILTPLLADIEQMGRDVIFILDDYHIISDPVIAESMRFLLAHAPINLHLILSTRADPELPLSHLRMRGQLLEIRNQDLRFTGVEAASFLVEGMNLPFSEEEVATLQSRSEGWIAGLQLAALSARKHENLSSFVQDFTGSHRFVLDFVQQDILAHLPDSLQDFMLQTSILTRMNARLCQAVTATLERAECQQMLVTLEQANLFVMPLDDRRQWYRYHDLFREALLTQLHARYPELVPLLHLRAAHFYKAQGETREAITHALAAPDYTYAANLMEQVAKHLWWHSGEMRAIHAWMLALPDVVLRAHVQLALDTTLHMLNTIFLSNETLYTMAHNQLERAFTKIEGLLRKKAELSLSVAEVALIQRRLFLLRALVEMRGLLQCGDTERMHQLITASEALPADPEAHWSLIPLQLSFWLTVMLKREGTILIPALLAARKQLVESGNLQAAIRVKWWLAHTYTQAAQWHRAYQEAYSALPLLEQIGAPTSIAGYLSACLFNACYARNQLEEAANWLSRLQQNAQDCQVVDLLVTGEVSGVRLALAQRDFPSAQQALDRLSALVKQEGFAHHTTILNLLRVQLWLAEGRLDQAHSWTTHLPFSENTRNPLHREELLTLVRVLLAQQQYAQADEMLTRFKHSFDQQQGRLVMLEWMILSAIALYYTGKHEQARHTIHHLLSLTEPEGYLRIYLDSGPLMRQLLKQLKHADDTGKITSYVSSVTRILTAFEQPAHTTHHIDSGLSEPLTPGEQRVLHLLVTGQTYAEIAQALIVSPNTIKTQISSIYRKLGVGRRTEAITKAERLHLLAD